MIGESKRWFRAFLPILPVAAAGAALALYAMDCGVGVSTDSVAYITAARGLLAGQGLLVHSPSARMVPLTRFPPLYPVLLAVAALRVGDVLLAARATAALLLAANVALVGVAVFRGSGGALWPAVLATLLMGVAPGSLAVHTMAWSEPLFITLTLLCLVLLARHLERPHVPSLLGAAFSAGLSAVTRYAGPASILMGLVALALYGAPTWRQRLRDLLAFAVFSGLPLALWCLRNLGLGQNVLSRRAVWHPITSQQLRQALPVVAGWLGGGGLPVSAQRLLLITFAAGLAVLRYYARRQQPVSRAGSRQAAVAGLFLLVYSAYLVLSISLFDNMTPLDDRILAPALAAALVCVPSAAWQWARVLPAWRLLRPALATLSVLLVALYALDSTPWLARTHEWGQGYTSQAWQRSPIVARLRALPAGSLIYTNAPDAGFYFTGRPVHGIPGKTNLVTAQGVERFTERYAAIGEHLAAEGGYLVYFRGLGGRAATPLEDELRRLLPLRELAREADGAIFVVSERGG